MERCLLEALHEADKDPITCPREESFAEMFDALGNAQAQQDIRREKPDKSHCSILRVSANACAELPQAYGSSPAGSICPNNPFERNANKTELAEYRTRLLAFTTDAHRSMKVGALTMDSPHREVSVAYLYDRWLQDRQWQQTF